MASKSHQIPDHETACERGQQERGFRNLSMRFGEVAGRGNGFDTSLGLES